MEEFTPQYLDESSKAWQLNKRKLKNGCYKYTCEYSYNSTKRCGRDVYKDKHLCRQHWAKETNHVPDPIWSLHHD